MTRENPRRKRELLRGNTTCLRYLWRVEGNLPKDRLILPPDRSGTMSTLSTIILSLSMPGLRVETLKEYAYPGHILPGHDGSNYPGLFESKGVTFHFTKTTISKAINRTTHSWIYGFYGGYWHNDEIRYRHYAAYDEATRQKTLDLGIIAAGNDMGRPVNDKTDGKILSFNPVGFLTRKPWTARSSSSNTVHLFPEAPTPDRVLVPGERHQRIEIWYTRRFSKSWN